MVIEQFRGAALAPVGERFRLRGRMLPEDVSYHASWMALSGDRCFQLMEAPSLKSLQGWMSQWDDLVAFDVVTVVESSEFWRQRD